MYWTLDNNSLGDWRSGGYVSKCYNDIFSQPTTNSFLRLYRPREPGIDLNFIEVVIRNPFQPSSSLNILDKLETTPLRVVVSYAYLVFSQPPACLHQAM